MFCEIAVMSVIAPITHRQHSEILTVCSVNASEGDMPDNFRSNNNYEGLRRCRCEDDFLFV